MEPRVEVKGGDSNRWLYCFIAVDFFFFFFLMCAFFAR